MLFRCHLPTCPTCLALTTLLVALTSLTPPASAASPDAGPAAPAETADPLPPCDHHLPEMHVEGYTDAAPLPLAEFTSPPPRDLLARPLTESPGLRTATTSVSRKEIQLFNAYSVVDALEYVPGGWTETRGRKVKQFFSVRGQRYPYPGYNIDGAWFREFHETNYYFSTANVDRIDLVRSSAALLLSPGGLAGIANIIPRTYHAQQTQLLGEVGTHERLRADIAHGNMIENLSYAVGLGFFHQDGPGENAQEDIGNLYGRLVYMPDDAWTFSLTAVGIYGDRELRLATPPADMKFQTRTDSFDPIRSHMLIGKVRHTDRDRSTTEFIANFAHRELDGHRVGSPDWVERDWEYGFRIVHSQRIGKNNTLRLSGLFNHWESPTGKRFYVGNPADLKTISFAIVDEHQFDRLTINAGYRYTQTYIDQFGGFNVEGSPAGLKSVTVEDEWDDPLHTITAGASYDLGSGWALYGNFTWGQVGAAPGMLNEQLERPDTETRTKFDLGVGWDCPGFGYASVTGFYVYQCDAALLTNKKITVNGEDYALFENADRENYGVEFAIQTRRFQNGLQLFFNATAMQTRRKNDDGGWMADDEMPELIFGGGLSWLAGDFEFVLLAKHVSRYENDRFLPKGADKADLGDFVDLTGTLNYYLDDQHRSRVYISVENMLDEEYSTVNGYPEEGARLVTGLVWTF